MHMVMAYYLLLAKDATYRGRRPNSMHVLSPQAITAQVTSSVLDERTITTFLFSNSEYRHLSRIYMVHILIHRLHSVATGAKDAIPQPRLLPVVVALPPPLPVV